MQIVHICPIVMHTVLIDEDLHVCSEKCGIDDCPLIELMKRQEANENGLPFSDIPY